MISIRKAEDRGQTRTSWLDSKHSFSFAHYYDPKHMGFGPLRVINEDRVAPGEGFGTHAHRDMEIISYVLEGRLTIEVEGQAPVELAPGQGVTIPAAQLSCPAGFAPQQITGTFHSKILSATSDGSAGSAVRCIDVMAALP